uniref:Putative secreted protein n=1 Tax=Ixodes ricinus TaxID=34613 RepID=A0A6B0V009_IXORI
MLRKHLLLNALDLGIVLGQELFEVEESRLVLGLVVVSKLDLALETRKLARLLQSHRVRRVQDGVPGLDIEQIQLHRVARVHVGVGEEVLATQGQHLLLVHSELAQRLGVVHPVQVVVRFELLLELLHLLILVFLLPAQCQCASVRLLVLVREVAYQREFVVVRDADFGADDDHEVGDGLAVVHKDRLD